MSRNGNIIFLDSFRGVFRAVVFITVATAAFAQEKITYDDHVTPILRNNCFKCHNPDKTKGELDLTTYNGVLKGGGSGKAVLPGDASGSKLFKSIARIEEPFMPDKGPKLGDADIELIRKWIAGGLLEKSSSQALAANKPRIGLLSSGASPSKKPEGPDVLPVEWRLEPVTRTERTTAVTALAASPWFPLVAVGGQHQLLVYQSNTKELLGVLPFPEVNPACVQFSRDSKLIMVGGGHGAKFGFVDVYDLTSGERVTRVGNEFDTVLAADLNSDQTEVALGGPAKHVKIFSTRDAKMVHDLKKHTDWVTAIQYSPDSVLLATGDRNGGLVIWEADSGQELYTLAGHTAAITAVSWRDDSDVLLSASEDGSIRVWEMKEGRQVATWTAHKDGVLDARFGHDARIVSCGRDKQIAVWDAGGTKQKNWDAGGDIPVRAAFSHDGSNVLASSWQGRIGIWLAADGKAAGEITSNPPTLAERLAAANKEVADRETLAAKAAQGIIAAGAEAKKIEVLMAAQDQASPAFQFIAASKQAQSAYLKAAAEAAKALDKFKAPATKSGAELAAAEAEASKVKAALDKTDKFSEPYQQVTKQLEATGQKVAAGTAKAAEASKALADKTAAINAAAVELATKTSAAVQARDKAAAALEELKKQSEAALQTAATARSVAEQDKAKVARQLEFVNQTIAALTSAENETARINQLLGGKDSVQTAQLSHQLELATQHGAEARATNDASQKTLAELKITADKSSASLAAAETGVAKGKTSLESGQKVFQAAKDLVTQLDAAKAPAAESARKETEALQAGVAQANAALGAAKAENSQLQAKLEKTEKFSDAFKEATKKSEEANKQAAALKVPAEHDRKEAADLEATLAKINAAAASTEAEAAKAIETMAKSDPGYQHFRELEKQLATARQKVDQANEAATKARTEVEGAKLVVLQVQSAQARMAWSDGRDALAVRQQTHEKLRAALVTAQQENTKATNDLNEATKSLAAQPGTIKNLQAEVQKTVKAADLARAALKEAGQNASKFPEAEASVALLIEKQNALKTATNQVQHARTLVSAGETRLTELNKQVKSLSDTAKKSAGNLTSARAALADSERQVAAEKERVDKLAAQFASLKNRIGADRADAKR